MQTAKIWESGRKKLKSTQQQLGKQEYEVFSNKLNLVNILQNRNFNRSQLIQIYLIVP